MTAGLTGGIATGKSAVAAWFTELGARIIDADAVAHEILLLPEVIGIVRDRFGEGVLTRAGQVDRKRLGVRIFSDPEARLWLNRLVHPRVRAEIARQLEAEPACSPRGLVIVDVPLLIESGSPRRYGPLILAYCPAAIQLQRLVARDGLTEVEARARIQAQMPIGDKLNFADFVIHTTGRPEDTRRTVREVYEQLMAGSRTDGEENRNFRQ